MKIKTTSRKVSHSSAGQIEQTSTAQMAGNVETEHGFVAVTALGAALSMQYIHAGRLYTRTCTKPSGGWWTAQGIVRPAKEFAAEIAER